jgi:hypothetical protein
MGGEYLPDFTGNEVEIARVSLASVTADVISVRARFEDRRVHYRLVDEYDTVFHCEPGDAVQPLTMGELIELTDGVTREGEYPDTMIGLTDAFRDMNYAGGDPRELLDFVTVSSDFYPELGRYYASEADGWVEEREHQAAKQEAERDREERERAEQQTRVQAELERTRIPRGVAWLEEIGSDNAPADNLLQRAVDELGGASAEDIGEIIRQALGRPDAAARGAVRLARLRLSLRDESDYPQPRGPMSGLSREAHARRTRNTLRAFLSEEAARKTIALVVDQLGDAAESYLGLKDN